MRVFWALLALTTPVALLYTQFLGNPLVFDDKTFFQSEEFSYYLNTLYSFKLRWFPYATFLWTREIFGDAMIWLRLGNLLLHLLTTATLFFFLRRLFELVIPHGNDDKTLSAFWLAFFGALIFALHPVSVYAVGYLVQRTTLMATLFTLLTWRLFLEGLVREQRLCLYASAVTYLLATLSKEHAIMAPAVTLALLVLISPQPLERIKLLRSTFVLYALISVFVIFQVKAKNVLGQAYEPVASELMWRLSGQFDPDLVYPLSILTQLFVFFKYLWVWLIPSPALMSVDICESFVLRLWSMPEALGLAGFIVYFYVAIRFLLQKGLKGLLGFAMLCPGLLFFTELATVRIQEIFVLYRSYLWMAGLFAGLPFLCQKLTAKQATISLSCIALLMMPLAWLRLDTFSHPFKLWDDAEHRIMDDKSCPVMDRILNNRGSELMALHRYSEAIEDFNRSLSFIKWQKKPMVSELAKNFYNRGFAYLKTGQFRLAINDFNLILEPIPKDWAALYFYKAQAFEGLLEMNSARQFYEKACLNGVQEGCEQQKKIEDSVK